MSLVGKILKSIEGAKAVNTRVLSNQRFGCQHVVITEGTSAAHINAIATAVHSLLKKSYPVVLVSDWSQKDWRIVWCESVMAHIMSPASRKRYDLECLLRPGLV